MEAGHPSLEVMHRIFDITVFDQARILDGQIVEHWGVPDRFALLAQTGVLARLG